MVALFDRPLLDLAPVDALYYVALESHERARPHASASAHFVNAHAHKHAHADANALRLYFMS